MGRSSHLNHCLTTWHVFSYRSLSREATFMFLMPGRDPGNPEPCSDRGRIRSAIALSVRCRSGRKFSARTPRHQTRSTAPITDSRSSYSGFHRLLYSSPQREPDIHSCDNESSVQQTQLKRPHQAALRHLGVTANNHYAAFMWLGIDLLALEGDLSRWYQESFHKRKPLSRAQKPFILTCSHRTDHVFQ